MDKREQLCFMGYEEAVVFDCPDYDNAIVGVSEDGRVIYDYDLMVEDLIKKDNIEAMEAIEFIEYNTIGALPSAGPHGPIIMHRIEEET